jgi:hypothetical protein
MKNDHGFLLPSSRCAASLDCHGDSSSLAQSGARLMGSVHSRCHGEGLFRVVSTRIAAGVAGPLPGAVRQFGPVTLIAMFGPAVLTGFEGQQTIGVATVNGALCLLHTSYTPPEGLLEKTQSVLAEACDERV